MRGPRTVYSLKSEPTEDPGVRRLFIYKHGKLVKSTLVQVTQPLAESEPDTDDMAAQPA